MNDYQFDDPFIKSHFDHPNYRLIKIIGQGGFGQVYQAQQNNTGQIVAIKFLKLAAQFDDSKKRRYIERFERETQLGSRLQHPNIVRLLDKGSCKNQLFYAVFEFVDGYTLKQHLTNHGPLKPIDAAQIMMQILEVLIHAHERGVIHRDIKPTNIMLTRLGNRLHVKVLDFGISTLTHESRQLDYKTLTLTQETLGTPSYSAPEQLRGEPVTAKTDLYVWGLVFIECLTARPAITASSIASIFHQQLSQSNVPLPPGIMGHPVARLLRRALNKKTSERSASAQEIYDQLNAINLSNLVGELTPLLDRTNHAQNEDTAQQTVMAEHGLFDTSCCERRQLTVLCLSLNINIVDGFDPDSEVIDALHQDQINQCQDIAIRYGGYHVGTLGNLLLFYFGYPTVSDSDSRLAARSALEISGELNRCNAQLRKTQGIEVRAKMGLHIGIVSSYADNTPQGQTVNFAIELAQSATVGQIYCSHSAKQSLARYIEFQPVGSDPQLPLYALIGERQIEACGFMLAQRTDMAFVGRHTELAQLNRFIDSEHTDSLHAAHIHGEAGIGKSRLMFELTDRAQHYTHSMAQCLPEQQNSALFPVFTLLKFQYNLHQLPCEQGIKLLSQAIDTSGQPTMVKHMSILISWLEWPLPQNMVASTLAPSQQRGWLFNILTALLCSQDAGYASVAKLFIFEDLHWADPTTQAFIAHLLKHDLFTRANHRLLITSRQPLPSVFNELAITELKLAKLKPDEAQQYIEALFDRQPLCGDLCQLILARTDGIPLFIEQLVKMMQQQNIVHMLNGQIELARADLASSLPANLRDSLQQKLDNLLYGKETAQLCAVIGRSFDYQLLQQASSHSASQVQLDITQLLDHEIIYQQRKVAGDHYIFRHALIKDAAYDSIPAATRQKMHLRLAQTIESKFAAMTKQSPQIIANHWSKAQQADKASHRYIQAAKKAQANYANDETIYYYQQAIDHLPADNLSPCQQRSVAQAFEGMSDSEMANGEHQKGRQALKNALGFVGENSLAAAEIYYKTGLSWGVNQQHEQALDAYRQAQECIADEPAPTDNNTAHWWNCWFNINSARLNIYYWKNDTDTMARLISLSSALVDKHGNDEQKANFIHDQLSLALRQQRFVTNTTQVAMAQRAQAMISSLQDIAITAKFELNTGLVLYCNGQYQSCYRQMSKALVSALKTNNIPFQTLCSTYMTVVLRQQNDVTQAGEYAERTLKIAQKAGMINYIAAAKANLAWIALRRGQNDEATILTNECLAMWQQQDADNLYPIQWLGLFVQLEITTKKSAGSETAIQQSQIAIINKLMDSKQQKLPTAIEQHLERYRVFDERDNSNTQCRRQIVSQILHQANKLGYL